MKPHKPSRPHKPARRRMEAREGPLRLYGIHAVEAALLNPEREIQSLRVTDNAENRLAEAIAKRQIAPERVIPRNLDSLLGAETVHQGALLETALLNEPELDDVAERAVAGGPLIVLDHVTDPHNVGAVLRSAAVFGAAGLMMTRRHSPPLDGTLAKSASGALEHVPVLLVQNLARSLSELKERGFLILGLDDGAETLIDEEPFEGCVALVFGAEGKGLRALTRETCDKLCRIGTSGPISSLNVSNAAAIALHLAAMRRRQA